MKSDNLLQYRSLPVYLFRVTFRNKKAAERIHTLLNLQWAIPTFIFVTSWQRAGRQGDRRWNQFERYDDRAYLDFERLHQLSAFFFIQSNTIHGYADCIRIWWTRRAGGQVDQTVLLNRQEAIKSSAQPPQNFADSGGRWTSSRKPISQAVNDAMNHETEMHEHNQLNVFTQEPDSGGSSGTKNVDTLTELC